MHFLILIAAMALSGCVSNGYREFYIPRGAPEQINAMRVAPAPTVPKVDRLVGNLGKFENYAPQYMRAGYVVIGYSSFNGAEGPERDAITQGKMVGADIVVIMNPQYTETVSSSIPITIPTTHTSVTNANATVYGSGGTATGYGTATTTTYGTQTTYIPMSVRRYDFGAVYLVKRKYSFGVLYAALTDEERETLQSNKGVKITTVVDGSPAFEEDFLVGDVVVKLNDRSVVNPEGFSTLLGELQGQRVNVTLLRQGQTLTKSVQLLP